MMLPKILRGLIFGNRSDTVNRVFNLTLALLIMTFALPVMALISLLVLLTSGFPILHRGDRLGHSRRCFIMYKFRTLRVGVEQQLGAKSMESSDRTVTPIGEFLRHTRLDELPQLFNVLRGDMNIVGPRPVRPAVYASFCMNMPGYDTRFNVLPGLIGQAQLFTPNGTPIRMRSMIDNRRLRRKQEWAQDMLLVVVTAFCLARTIIGRLLSATWGTLTLMASQRRLIDRRAMPRAHLRGTQVRWIDGSQNEQTGQLINANEEAFLMTTEQALADAFPQQMVLEASFQRRGRERTRRARCNTELFNERHAIDGLNAYVVRYSPVTPFHHYVVHQYILTESIIGPQHLC